MLKLPEKVKLVEVGPRDGLQSIGKPIATDLKVRMVDRLSQVGFPVIEVTGFAHPRVIPNLADAEEVCARIQRRPGTVYRGLAPNARGAERAARAKVDEVLGLVVASPTYLKHNQNMSIEEAVDQGIKGFRIADDAGIAFVMAIGMSMWCPYEGRIPDARVIDLVGQLRNSGIRRLYLAGSMGMEDPRQVSELFGRTLDRFPDVELGFHVHNMSGFGTANVIAALDAGAHWLEGAICGLGGGIAMPKTLASVGNLPSEDLVALLNESGIETGLDLAEVVAASREIAKLLDIEARSFAVQAGTKTDILEWGRFHPKEHPA